MNYKRLSSPTKNNSPPEKLLLPTMCGIDSLHLQIKCSISELTALVNKCGLGIFVKKRTKWTTLYEITLTGEIIQVVITKRRTCHLEFGGLYYNTNSENKLRFIRKLTQTFDRWKVSRMDFACDLKISYHKLFWEVPDGFKVGKEYRDSIYFNRNTKSRTATIVIYNRSLRIDLFSFPVTRIELRLYKGILHNRKLGKCLLNGRTLEKCVKLIEKMLIEALAVSVNGKSVLVDMNVTEVLHNFVEFLQSDSHVPKDKDLFHLKEAFVVRDKVISYMKNRQIDWKSFPQHCKMQQTKVCKNIGISHPILRKALRFAKAA